MGNEISLWTPVVIARLPAPHTCREVCKIHLEAGYKRIDDIRVKTRDWQATRQTKYLGASIELEIIVLYEDDLGNTRIFCRPYIIKERIDAPRVDKNIVTSDVRYVLQIENLHWDAELIQDEIVVEITTSYMINIVREQVVKLNQNITSKEGQMLIDGSNEEDISRIQGENETLARRIGYYQKDVLSLQHGIRKVEERNAQLNRELDQAKEQVQLLQETITRKELLLSKYKHIPSPNPSPIQPSRSSDNDVKIGQRLKRLLLNCL